LTNTTREAAEVGRIPIGSPSTHLIALVHLALEEFLKGDATEWSPGVRILHAYLEKTLPRTAAGATQRLRSILDQDSRRAIARTGPGKAMSVVSKHLPW
jgi:hypothetical protein